ncbi:MAG: hypothetical protein BME94_00680 [Methanobacteriales archaeon Met13]
MISVVCVYNDPEILNKYLLSSLKYQEKSFELILLDNTQNQFKSAAQALNHGAQQATGKYIMFIHQDLQLRSSKWLHDVEAVLESIQKLGVGGVAGRRGHRTISNMEHGNPPVAAGIYSLNHMEEVQTVDECLAIIPRKLFDEFQFDAETCQGWHLYVADYCLVLKNRGCHVYVLPHSTYHLSAGSSFSENYYQTVGKLREKHRKDYKWMYTTAGNWHTIYPLFLQIIYNKTYRLLVKIRSLI